MPDRTPVWQHVPDAVPPALRDHPTEQRARAIRQAFRDLGGTAVLRELVDACRDRGLLDGLTRDSAWNAVRRALWPIAIRVSPGSPLGQPWVRRPFPHVTASQPGFVCPPKS